MTPDPEAQRSLEVARHDIEAIKALQKNEHFNRYWLRRLKDRRDLADRSFHEDPPSKCDPMQREALRQVVEAYDGLLTMMQIDERLCREKLEVDARRNQ